MVIMTFYFGISVKFTLSTISQRWRNHNISLDLCYKNFFMIKIPYKKEAAVHRFENRHSWKFRNIGAYLEAATGVVLYKKMFLKISQNSQENTCARVSFLIERLWHRCFLVNFVKFSRTPFLQNTSGQGVILPTMITPCSGRLLLPYFKKDASLFLQNSYSGCFWIFAAENTFLQLNLVFIADSRTSFYSGLLRKHELNLRNSHWGCSVFRNFANFTGLQNCKLQFPLGLQLY